MELDIPSLILCPHCGCQYYQEEVISSNTFGATLWSDGITVGSGVPSFESPYGKCTQCGGYYVVRKSRAKDQRPLAGANKIGSVRAPSAMDCITILEKKEVLPGEDPLIFETNLRRLIWYHCNDVIRYGEENDRLPETKVQRDNMERLSALLSATGYEEDLLTAAELLRQLGRFSECRALLAKVNDQELQRTKRRIRWLALMRNSRLAIIWSGRRRRTRRMLRRIWRNYESFFSNLFR